MSWRRIGLVLAPDAVPWAHSHVSLPTPVPIGGETVRVFFSARDAGRRSHIGWADVVVGEQPVVVGVSPQPVLVPGEDGAFDDSGVSIGSIVADGTNLRLYYMGWNLGVRSPWRNAIGIAEMGPNATEFTRMSPGPFLDRAPEDPYTLSYPCVLRLSEDDWRMWYGSNLNAAVGNADMSHVIKAARSADGLRWRRDGRTVIGFRSDDEYAIARPSVSRVGEGLLMAFACRGERYRIGAAISTDGESWTRRDDLCGLPPAADGWDSEMTCYPALFTLQGRLWMAYNGNNYGATGIGLAVWDGPLSFAAQ